MFLNKIVLKHPSRQLHLPQNNKTNDTNWFKQKATITSTNTNRCHIVKITQNNRSTCTLHVKPNKRSILVLSFNYSLGKFNVSS